MKRYLLFLSLMLATSTFMDSQACTGITLKSKTGATVPARTIEWAKEDILSRYVIVPRGYEQQSFVPGGKKDGLQFTAKYGYVGLAVSQDEFVVEGFNEAGLSAGLFYFPDYGKYETYSEDISYKCISDFQLVSWILSRFKNIDEFKAAMEDVVVVGIDPRSSTVHWRVTEPSGRQVVVEIIDQKVIFYENELGVLTNSPSFDWHLTNLNNYINLSPGTISTKKIGNHTFKAIGGGAGLHGLPGDVTPPSRFIRAAFYQLTAPIYDTTEETVMQAFHILNNFDIPVGIQYSQKDPRPTIPSATQFTVATDIKGKKIYYRTMYNSEIRCIDLNKINFQMVQFQSVPLDVQKKQGIVMLN